MSDDANDNIGDLLLDLEAEKMGFRRVVGVGGAVAFFPLTATDVAAFERRCAAHHDRAVAEQADLVSSLPEVEREAWRGRIKRADRSEKVPEEISTARIVRV